MDKDETNSEDLDSTKTGHTQSPASPEWIGPYRILERLGEGGMGEVWLAEQTQPVKRKVALKVIKQGLDTKQVVARFEAERQALALMDHPAIAKVFDAGTTPGGRPYIAMEYVRGIPITQHCDRHKLTTGQRLDLFREVCEGVQHAHQKAVIHRDLKPTNVLVAIQDDKPVPKIIDFGVAKATTVKLTEKTLHTQLGVMIGTPAYMSPEQAGLTEQDIDTRTDVYALGVILYELLVGALPFDSKELRKAGLEAMVRKIREDDPPRPSTRLSTLGDQSKEFARLRRTELTALRRALSGDLDWIVMKALEKDRIRRYGSPNELAADVARHLAHEPVLAGPPSATYRMRKFVRRHRLGVGFAGIVALMLVGFAWTMAMQAQRIAQERDRANAEAVRANREADTSKRVSQFMTRLFAIPDPGEARGNEVTAREILDRGAEQIERGLRDEPLLRAQMMATMGNTYRNLGLLDQGQSLLEQALEIQSEHLDDDDAAIGDTLFDLGFVHFRRQEYVSIKTDEALSYWTRALEIRQAVLRPNDLELASTLTHLGLALMYVEEPEEAEVHAREAQEIWDSRPDAADWRAANNAQLLAWLAEERGDFAESLALTDYSLDLFDRATEAGEYWSPLATTLNDAGIAYENAGRFEEALQLFQRSVDYREHLYGPNHARVAEALAYKGMLYRDTGRFTEARQLLEQALAIQPQQKTMNALSLTLLRLGEIEGAYEYRRRVMEIREADPKFARNSALLGGRLQLAYLLMRLERFTEARVQYRSALDLFAEDPRVAKATLPGLVEVDAFHDLAELVAEASELEDAHVLFELALFYAQRCNAVARRPALQVAIHHDHAALLRRMGRDTEAAEHEALAAEMESQP